MDAKTKAQLTTKHSKHYGSGQLLFKIKIQPNSNSAQNQSTLSNLKIRNFNKTSINAIQFTTMSRKDTKKFTDGFIPAELKITRPRGRTVSVDWNNTSDREESLSDPRWFNRPPGKGKKTKKTNSPTNLTSNTQVTDASELITGSKQTSFLETAQRQNQM